MSALPRFILLYAAMYAAFGVASPFLPRFLESRGLPLPVMYAEGRPMLRDRIASLRHANIYEPQRYRHVVSSTLVERIDEGRARSVAHFLVVRIMQDGDALLFASGRYVDRIALSPQPRYEERVVVCDSRRFDTLLAIPL